MKERMLSLEETVEQCLIRWGTDSKNEKLLEKTREWIINVKESDKHIFYNLMLNFNYYRKKEVNDILRKLHERYVSKRRIEETIFVPLISPEGRYNRSYEILIGYKEVNNLSKYYTPTEYPEIINNYNLKTDIKNIVFIDDMIGSGLTVDKAFRYILEHYIKLLDGMNVYLMIIGATTSGLEKLDKLKSDYNLNIEALYYRLEKKAFDINHIFKDESMAKDIVVEYEENINKAYALGFKRVEGLLAFYYDTPNTTLCSFWSENEKIGWKPLFPREKTKQPSWANDVKEKVKLQNKLLYNLKKESSNEGKNRF